MTKFDGIIQSGFETLEMRANFLGISKAIDKV